MAQMVKNRPAVREAWVRTIPWVRKIPCRREWLPTRVFLPRDFHGQGSLVSYSLWGHRVGHDWGTSTSTFLSESPLDLGLYTTAAFTNSLPSSHQVWAFLCASPCYIEKCFQSTSTSILDALISISLAGTSKLLFLPQGSLISQTDLNSSALTTSPHQRERMSATLQAWCTESCTWRL